MRMLGSGRPFMFEIINARAGMPDQAAFDAMQDAQNKVTPALHVWLCPQIQLLTGLHACRERMGCACSTCRGAIDQ